MNSAIHRPTRITSFWYYESEHLILVTFTTDNSVVTTIIFYYYQTSLAHLQLVPLGRSAIRYIFREFLIFYIIKIINFITKNIINNGIKYEG